MLLSIEYIQNKRVLIFLWKIHYDELCKCIDINLAIKRSRVFCYIFFSSNKPLFFIYSRMKESQRLIIKKYSFLLEVHLRGSQRCIKSIQSAMASGYANKSLAKILN